MDKLADLESSSHIPFLQQHYTYRYGIHMYSYILQHLFLVRHFEPVIVKMVKTNSSY